MGKKIHEKLSELKDIAINNQIEIEIFQSIELEIQKNIRMIICLLETNHPSGIV
jgi:hypothetical protein